MNPTLMTGMTVVIIALSFYTLFIHQELKHKKVTPKLLLFLTVGLSLDFTATLLMILGSVNTPFTIHGMIGYSALSVMLIDTVLLWRLRFKYGLGTQVFPGIHTYSILAYGWWVVAFITGGIIAMIL
jgi:hypothetical protein